MNDNSIHKFLDIGGGATTPLAVSAISGVIAMVASAVTMSIIANSSIGWLTSISAFVDANLLSISAIVGVLTTAVVWRGELTQRREAIYKAFIATAEDALNVDINRDGVIGTQPEPRVVVHEMRVTSNNGRSQRRYNLNWSGDWDVIIETAVRSLNGVEFTERNYMRGENRIMTPAQFKSLREQWLRQGVLVKKDSRPNAGVIFGDEGMDLLRAIVAENIEEVDGEIIE